MAKMETEPSSCPACGAPLEFPHGATRIVCQFCGYAFDLPPAGSEAEVQSEQFYTQPEPAPVLEPEPVYSPPPPEQTFTPPPPTAQPAQSSTVNWPRVLIGCLSGCGTALVLGVACSLAGFMATRLADRSGMGMNNVVMRAPAAVISISVLVALIIGLVVFLAVALTGRRKS